MAPESGAQAGPLNSEISTNLLIDIGSHFGIFSECALKSLPDPLDFDSAIRVWRID